MEKPHAGRDLSGPDSPHFSDPAASATAVPLEFAAWEEVDAGRYMPRRVRGSCQGRVLGWTFVVPSPGPGETNEDRWRTNLWETKWISR